ncbi:putative ribonuclease H-like domain-containing protein [Tanacetum coccineum]
MKLLLSVEILGLVLLEELVTPCTDEVMYSFFAQQTTNPILKNEDLQQIDGDDLEEVDLRWQVAMLTVRVKKFIQKTGRNLDFKEKQPVSFDKSKVECYNYHRKGHFARECKSGRNQWRRSYELVNYALMAISSLISSSSSDNEVQNYFKKCLESFKTLQTNFDSEREKHNRARLEIQGYELALESLESRILGHEKNELAWGEKYEFQNYELKCKEIKIDNLKMKLEKVVKERDELKVKIEKWEESSKGLNKLLNSQMSAHDKNGLGYGTQLDEMSNKSETDGEISLSIFEVKSSDEENIPANDRFSKADGYHGVPPPITGNFLTPRADISFAGLDEFAIRKKIIESKTTELYIETSETVGKTNEVNVEKPKSVYESVVLNQRLTEIKSSLRIETQMMRMMCLNCKQLVLLRSIRLKQLKLELIKLVSPKPKLKYMVNNGQRVVKPVWDNAKRVNHQKNSNKLKYPQARRTFVPSGVLTRTGLVNSVRPNVSTVRLNINTARSVGTARPFAPQIAQTGSAIRPIYPRMDNVRPRASYSPIKRSYYTKPAFRPKDLKQDVKTFGVKNMTTAGTSVVVNTSKGKMENDLKKSRWVWRPKGNYMDHKSKESGSFMLKKFKYVDPKGISMSVDYAIVDSGCSNHMTGNKAYLSDYEDYNRGFMAFGSDSKGGLENQLNHKVKIIRCDHGTEFKNYPVNEFCAKKGIKREFSMARTPQQNDVTERKNRTLIEAARTMLADSLLPIPFWAEAVNTACYVLNRVLVTKPQNKTPYELLLGKPPSISFMRPFGCPLTILNTLDLLGKFDGKANEGYLLGYSTTRIGPDWMFDLDFLTNSMNYIPVSVENHINVDASTHESYVVGSSGKDKEPSQEYILHPIHPHGPMILVEDVVQVAQEEPSENAPKDNDVQDSEDVAEKEENKLTEAEQALKDDLDDLQDRPLKKKRRKLHLLRGQLRLPVLPNLILFKLQKVWVLVDLPSRKRAISTKWVFKNKRDERSIVVKNKARLVVQGFRKEEGFVDPAHPNKVYKVIKALYGLHQAPRAWYETLSSFLLENGFRRVTIDKTLFIKKSKSDIMLVQVYVDGIIFGFTKQSMCTEFEECMHKRFQMSSMGKLTFFLGLQVKQQPDGIFISQDKYVADILKKFDFWSIRTATTPIESNKPLVKDEDGVDVDVHVYRSMIGSLMYLTASRPDIMFAVCAYARHQVTPKASHLNAIKRIFRYLKHQPKLGLWYPRDSPFELEAFSDSNYRGASLNRKSTIGGCQFLGKRLISWQCKKQTIVANSTTEAKSSMGLRMDGSYAGSFTHIWSIVDFLKGTSLRYALTHNPTIYDSLVKQFWQTATVRTLANGIQELTTSIDNKEYTITRHLLEVNFNWQMQQGYAGDHVSLLLAMLAGATEDQGEGSIILAATHPIPIVPDTKIPQSQGPTTTHVADKATTTSVEVDAEGAATTTSSLDAGLDSGNIPKSPLRSYEAPLHEGHTSGSAEDSLQLKELMEIAVLTLVDRVKTLEVALKRKTKKVVMSKSEDEEPEDQGRKIQDIDEDPLVSLVRDSMKETYFVTPTKVSASREAQEEEISPTILEAAKTLSQVASQTVSTYKRRARSTDKGKDINTGLDAKAEVNTGSGDFNTSSIGVNTGSGPVSTPSVVQTIIHSPVKSQREGKAPMTTEEVQPTKRTKAQIQQEKAGLAEAVRLQAQLDEEIAKQVHLDEMEDWDVIRAKLEANAELTKNMLGKDLPEEDFAKRMVDMVNQRKKHFVEERAKAKRSKPMTQSQLRDYMSNYLKNQGTWKISQLKNLSFEENKENFDKTTKKQKIVHDSGSAKLQEKDTDKDIPVTEEKVEDVKEEEPVNNIGKRKKHLARKGISVDKTAQDETEEKEAYMKEKVTDPSSGSDIGIDVIPTATKPPSIVNWKIIPQPGQKAIYQIIRKDGSDKIYTSFGAILQYFLRDDLTELYRLMIEKYGANRPEEMYDRVL